MDRTAPGLRPASFPGPSPPGQQPLPALWSFPRGLTAGCVPLQLAHRHPGPGQPSVRATAEERDHLVRALPLGVSRPWELLPQETPIKPITVSGQRCPCLPACIWLGRELQLSLAGLGEMLWYLCIVAVVSWSRCGAAGSVLGLSKSSTVVLKFVAAL